MSKKTDERLNKLAGFGQSAGSKPAAAALIQLTPPPEAKPEAPPEPPSTPEPPEPPEEKKSPDSPAPDTPPKPTAAPKEPPRVKIPEAKALLVRNVGFTSEDQEHLDRISELLRQGGEFRPSISDLVRVALRGCKSLSVAEAKKILDSSRKFDGRRKR